MLRSPNVLAFFRRLISFMRGCSHRDMGGVEGRDAAWDALAGVDGRGVVTLDGVPGVIADRGEDRKPGVLSIRPRSPSTLGG